MDKNSLLSKLNKLIPGAVLETRGFGRSGLISIWIEVQSIPKVALFLKNDAELKLDYLENLSVVEFEDVLVLSYFVRSTVNNQSLLLRGSVVPPSKEAVVSFPSVTHVWPMGEYFEDEASEMFGIKFKFEEETSTLSQSTLLPENWKGFPLRKSYQFPTEIFGLEHERTQFNPPNGSKHSQ